MKKSKKIMFALLVSVFSILIGLVFAVFAQEESPQLPHLFYISTIKADQSASFESGKIEELNLTWNFSDTVAGDGGAGGGGGGGGGTPLAVFTSTPFTTTLTEQQFAYPDCRADADCNAGETCQYVFGEYYK